MFTSIWYYFYDQHRNNILLLDVQLTIISQPILGGIN